METDEDRLSIEGGMTIYQAAALKARLLAPVERYREVEIDLSGVAEIDSAGVQLMILAKMEATARGVALQFTGHSQAVMDALDLFNLGHYFGDPLVIQSGHAREGWK